MACSASAASQAQILPWLEESRRLAPGQIVHDSLHARPGWTQAYLLKIADQPAGFGAVAVGGPWKGTRTVFAFHVSPGHLPESAGLFAAFLRASAATDFEIQTQPPLLHQLATGQVQTWTTDRIVFRDDRATDLPTPPGAVFGRAVAADQGHLFEHRMEPVGGWVVRRDGEIVATGGWLSHYNPPYQDLFLEVAEPWRRRGIGSWLLQELKQACRGAGGIPCARCHPENQASRRSLAKAGFVPWCDILTSPVVHPT